MRFEESAATRYVDPEEIVRCFSCHTTGATIPKCITPFVIIGFRSFESESCLSSHLRACHVFSNSYNQTWIHVGEAADIQTELLRHLNGIVRSGLANSSG